jgi:ketosteroid isomerase-like protein
LRLSLDNIYSRRHQTQLQIAKGSNPMNRKWLTAALLFVALVPLSLQAQHYPQSNRREAKTNASIRAVLDAQSKAWNRGDIVAYMDGYDRSPDTEFVGGDTITRGWQTVLERYQKKYDSREKMGTLTFSDIEINVLSNDAALVLGRWSLQRASDRPHGTFSLVFRRKKAGWLIVHDHSSSA